MASPALDKSVPEILPPSLDATAEQPPLFDGITKLYTCYTCPFAQRVWIARNFKGLQDEIKLVPLILQNRPAWYSEKVYPPNKGKITGESLDLIKYLESNFQGPSLLHEDPAKKEFTGELLSYSDTFNRTVFTSFKGDIAKEAVRILSGPFFLGQEFSLVDIAYITFVERFYIFLSEVFKHDITAGRPKLTAWIEEVNKIEAYKQTKTDPKEMIETYKNKFMA
ncbi:In2-1 family protein [Salix suchowensis]|nr:In2-1 family protein [Salix suchowensis]